MTMASHRRLRPRPWPATGTPCSVPEHTSTGYRCASSARSFGTTPSPTSAEPPNLRGGTSSSRCRATPSAATDVACRLDLASVHLTVSDRQRIELVAVGARHRARRVRVEPAAEKERPPARDSDASGLRVPDVLVRLELESDVESVCENPGGELLRLEHPVDGRKQDGRSAAAEIVRADNMRAYS